jgi:phosphatidylglycerol:prolipoprotein diacylglycerol transferase
VLFAAGALLAWWWFVRARPFRWASRPSRCSTSRSYGLLGGLLGAKLTLIVVDLPYYLANPWQILGTIRSAGVLMGGVAVGALAFVVYASRAKLPILTLGDAIAAPLALAQGIGRLGCFAAGCCWGVGSDAWCAVRFTSAVAHEQDRRPAGGPAPPRPAHRVRFRRRAWPCS